MSQYHRFQVVSKITVNYPKSMASQQRNSTKGISFGHLQDFERLFWMAVSKVILTDWNKNMFHLGVKVTITASTDSQKSQQKHLWWGLFLNKDSGWVPATLLQRNCSIRVFWENSEKFLKTLTFETLFVKFQVFTK